MKISAFVSVLVASALAVVSGMTDKATGKWYLPLLL